MTLNVVVLLGLLGCAPSAQKDKTRETDGESSVPTDDSGDTDRHETGDSGPVETGGEPIDDDPEHDEDGCERLYHQDVLPEFELELSDEDWAALRADYSTGTKAYHPAVFRYTDPDGEVEQVDDAAVRLKGNPGFSWIGDKMQFVISFKEYDDDGRFHGLRHIALDSSWYDPSILRDRLSYALFRRRGVPAPCANNATLSINGEFYGLYANIEHPDQELLERLFGDEDATGTLWKYGYDPTVNEDASDGRAINAFWADTTVANHELLGDLEANLVEWSVEVVLPQNDGYWCCNHNYYLYEHPSQGILFLPWDNDFSFDDTPFTAQPYSYYRDSASQPHFDAVVADPTWGPVLVDEIAASVDTYDPDWIEAQVEDWEAQISEPFALDQVSTHTVGAQRDGAARLITYSRNRHAWLEAWTRCEQGGGDGDGDGVDACLDCDDDQADIHPGVEETCDGRDDDCDGLVDEIASCDTCQEYSFGASRLLFCPNLSTWDQATATCEAHGATLGAPITSQDWYIFWLHNYWQEFAWAGITLWWADSGAGASGGTCPAASPSSWSWTTASCDTERPFVCRLPDEG